MMPLFQPKQDKNLRGRAQVGRVIGATQYQ